MFTKFVSKKIQETLNAKERVLSRKENTAFSDNRSADSYRTISDIASRTPFVRMISNKTDVPNVVISGGERNEDGTMKHGFGSGQTGIYFDTKAADSGKSQSGIRPIGGIRNLEVAYKGGFKALREANVSWTVGSLEDLERLTPYFLTVGKTVMIDWGWANSDKSLQEQFGTLYYSNGKVNPQAFTNHQSQVLDIGGNYGLMGGVISNFEYQLREDGGFDCTTKVIAMGANLFKKPVDKGISDKSLVGELDEEGKEQPAFLPVDSLVQTIFNLRELIISDVFGVDLNTKMWSELTREKDPVTLAGLQRRHFFNAISKSTVAPYKKNKLLFKETSNALGGDIGIITDKTGNILWHHSDIKCASPTGLIHEENIYVTWGWFEDQVLSRYVSYVGDDQRVKMTLRSVDTVTDSEGLPVKMSDDKDRITGNLNKHKIKKSLWFTKDKIDANREKCNDTLKKPTEISNHRFLHSKDISKFLILGQGVITGDNLKLRKTKGSDITKGEIKGNNIARKMYNTLLNPSDDKIDFKKFAKDPDDEDLKRGYLRHIYVNINEIKKAFGFGASSKVNLQPFITDNKTETIATVSDINPPSSIEAGIKNLLNQLNNNFYNIWNFELTVDPYDSTNIKVADKNLSLESGGSIPYTEFDPTTGKVSTGDGAPANGGIYKFPSFKMGSIVKSQNLSFKIPNASAITAMYGSNKNIKSVTNDPQHDNSDLNTVFSKDTSKEYQDGYLKGMESTYRAPGWGTTKWYTGDIKPSKNRVGSIDSSVNSRILPDEGGLAIDPNAPWGLIRVQKSVPKQTMPDEAMKDDLTAGIPLLGWALGAKDKVEKQKAILDSIPKFSYSEGSIKEEKFETEIAQYYRWNKESQSFTIMGEAEAIVGSVIRGTVENSEERDNFYKSDFIIPAELSLEVDGTEGLIPGDIIQTDYIPTKYNKEVRIGGNLGPFTYFQVFGVTHKIDSSGWTTEIQTKMRTNRYVLNKKAGEVVAKLRSARIIKDIDPTPVNNTTVWEEATDAAMEAQIAEEEGIEDTDTGVELPVATDVDSDDLTDGEHVEAATAKSVEITAETAAASNQRLATTMQISKEGTTNASDGGMKLDVTPLTGTYEDGTTIFIDAEVEYGVKIYQQKSGGRRFFRYIDENNHAAGTRFVDNVKKLKDGRIVFINENLDKTVENVLKNDISKTNTDGCEIIVGEVEEIDSDAVDLMTLEQLHEYMNKLDLAGME